MRNLVEYPITKEEVIECLERLKREVDEPEAIGDMRPMLIQAAIAIVKEYQNNDELFKAIDQRLADQAVLRQFEAHYERQSDPIQRISWTGTMIQTSDYITAYLNEDNK